MYELQAAAVLEDDDIWYNRIIANIDRLLKILTAQTTAIDSLERKLNSLTRKIPPQTLVSKKSPKGLKTIRESPNNQRDSNMLSDAFQTLGMG